MDYRWTRPAWEVAKKTGMTMAEAAEERRIRRRRQKSEWDAKNMRTISTRMRLSDAVVLDRYCREAHVTKYELLLYMVRAWMAAWETFSEAGS